jgi:hypothetical protein
MREPGFRRSMAKQAEFPNNKGRYIDDFGEPTKTEKRPYESPAF